ncbi:hypothetical protein [Aurantibacter aestuarii]|uniref:Uncharacterized protein n=1 Tax=Aurantibacter aestuarii TaxID=1266046 RepID=A0A2T1N9U6_9FLAO|nr:hypothetical protein [Aurantibacter aestuarii]PSG88622.1 hypothetical protein C7H52_10035 [Aurantibacter aestuarii]
MSQQLVLNVLKWTCFFIFAGRAYQFLFWDAPFRSVLWDQDLLSPIVEGIFNIPWKDYVTSLQHDSYIQNSIRLNGVFYALCAFLSLIVQQNSSKIVKGIIFSGGTLLVILALLQTKSKFYVFAMFFEHAIQFGSPFLLLFYLKHFSVTRLIQPLKLMIALTFLCHGLYALGYFFPLPANFVTMTMNILGTDEPTTKTLLFVAALLDFVIVIGIYMPQLTKYVLAYAVFWGFITAFARIWSELVYSSALITIHQTLYETIFRLSHGLIPLLYYIILKKTQQETYKPLINNRINSSPQVTVKST